MSAPSPPPLPLLTRIPPGLWPALAWYAAAVAPIVEYVLMPPQQAYSLNYPRDGLDPPGARLLLGLAFALVLVGSVLLRRRSGTAFGLLMAGTAVSTLAWRQDEIPPTQFLALDVALCYLAATRPRRESFTAGFALLGLLGGYALVRLLAGVGSGIAQEPFVALTAVTAWLIGNSVHQARAHTEDLHARAAVQAVTAERLRIAREMHDTVAHSIGIIALQAGAAARVVGTQPERAREAMLTVEQAGRETLAGLRRMLGALRQADQHDRAGGRTGPAHGPAPLQPAAGLADVEQLAARTTAAGVRVEVRWRGRRRPLPAEVDLAAFRIVQESVTNAVRHSGSDSCRVDVDYGEEELTVEVSDRGAGGGTGTDSGYGLAGMRERVALLHGDFTAGPRPGGGFRVAARIPVPAGTGTGAKTGTA
ncbi:sensor histidine kinase [Streptomyces sp. NPDC058646]|uniref:sensor histidine kinase n=1 Tax=Streptomyces sp. NPDC058646 TaxID=3346574 RepID=UPI00365885F9